MAELRSAPATVINSQETAARVDQIIEPPSTLRVSPVTQWASFDAKNATTLAMSSGSARCLGACIPSALLRRWSALSGSSLAFATRPGATAFTRIPRAPSANAKCFTSVSTAPFVAGEAGGLPKGRGAAGGEGKKKLPAAAQVGADFRTRKEGPGNVDANGASDTAVV